MKQLPTSIESEKNAGSVYDLPRELWIAILSRFGYRPLMRWRLVSAAWHALAYESVREIVHEAVTDSILRRCVSLERLELNRSNVTNHGISQLRHLRILALSGSFSQITDTAIAQLTNLTAFSPYNARNISIEGVSNLCNLKHLNLRANYRFDDAGITKLSKLMSLDLDRRDEDIFTPSKDIDTTERLTDMGLARLTNLTALSLTVNYEITDNGIRDLVNLTLLDLRRNEMISDEGLSRLTNMRTLRLNASVGESVTDSGISAMLNLTSLSLDFNERITDDCLSRFTNLTCLSLSFAAGISDVGLSVLRNLKLLALEANDQITDHGVSGLSNLTVLNLCRNSQISDAGISMLTNLTHLDLLENERITRDCFSNLVNLYSVSLGDRTYVQICDVPKSIEITTMQWTIFGMFSLKFEWYF
jgi:hypothetical protein